VTHDDLVVIGKYLETGKLKPAIENTYSLKDAASALRQIDEGRARGKTVIVIP
jgi:NADPH:quinone reductase and related Zn-dependent oxidoreductases